MDKKITIAQIKEVAQQAYDLYKTNTEGKSNKINITELGRISSE